jgi:hypothetical protein
MANEFIARRGLIVSGSTISTGGFTGSLAGTATTASFATSASFAATASAVNVNTSTVIHVDKTNPNATDNRTGLSKYSVNRPFQTVQAAFNTASQNDIIRVFGGTYTENVSGSFPTEFRTLELHNSSIQTFTSTQNSMRMHINGYGNPSITGIDTLFQGAGGDMLVVQASNIYLTSAQVGAGSTFRNVSITTTSSLWGGSFYDCIISQSRSTSYDTYQIGSGVEFYNCTITNTGGGFVPIIGGGSSGGTPTIRFETCKIDVSGSFLSSRGSPRYFINNSEITFTGTFLHNDGGSPQIINVQNCKLINNNTGSVLFSNLIAGDQVYYYNNIRNTTADLGISAPTIKYVVGDISNGGIKWGTIGTDVHQVTGSLNISGSITGSLRGTATSASYAVFAEGVVSPFLLMGA